MCDCYGHECEVKRCKDRFPWHIADYDYPRSDFKMWCPKHLDMAHSESVYYQIATKGNWIFSEDMNYSPPSEFELWAVLGPEVGDLDNCPNAGHGEYRIITKSDMLTLREWQKKASR